MKINQKIRKQGGSFFMLLPMAFIQSRELKEGDFIEVDSKHIKDVNKLKGGKEK